MKNLANYLGISLRGIAMGIAEVIPGISGGTIAFITGIYEKLIFTIKAFGPALYHAWRAEGLTGAWKAINGPFLTALLFGMVGGLIFGVLVVTHLLENYPILLWAFFFGLIIGSVIYIGRQVGRWKSVQIIALLAGTAIAFYITIASPAEGNQALWFVFISGTIAISALMLPGISGSFILLLMGMYTFIIPTVKEALKTFDSESLTVLAVFGSGALVGLVVFSRILSWTLKRYHSQTLALLTGFMLGSLNRIWPWRKPVTGVDETGQLVEIRPGVEVEKIIEEVNLWPADYAAGVGEPYLAGALVLMLLGFASVFLIEKLANRGV